VSIQFISFSLSFSLSDSRARPLAQSQVERISFATHERFSHPLIAWEAYESACKSNLVHRLPYYPPLVQDSGISSVQPDVPIASPSRMNNRRSESEQWVPPTDDQSVVSQSRSANSTRTRRTHTVQAVAPAYHNSTSPSNSHRPSSPSQSSSRGPPSTTETNLSMWMPDIEDPWNGRATRFVIFSSAVPGIFKTWYVASLCDLFTILMVVIQGRVPMVHSPMRWSCLCRLR
jgi:hypothetical protein